MSKVVVIGAGISGLSTAFALLEESRRRGSSAPEILVLETEPDAGGKVRTETVEGYLCERGPNGFLDNSPPTLELCRDLGLEGSLVRAGQAASRKRYLLLDGRLVQLPTSPWAFLTSPMLPLRARLQVLLEPFIGRGNGEESVAAFARRRLGAQVAEKLGGAMVSGIYGGDPEELSVDAAFPKLKRLEREHGSLVRGSLALAWERRKARTASEPSQSPASARATLETGPSGTLTSFRSGLSELIDALAERLGPARLRTGVHVGPVIEQGLHGR